MVYQYQLGRRAQALRAYERCRQMLLEQFGVDPMSQTQTLHTEILRQESLETPGHFQRITAPVEASRPSLPARLPFVGRDDEMDLLQDRLLATINGQGGLVLISGEAGIGKTRLAEEFLALADARSAQVFSGRCHELEQNLPYQPLRESLRPYLLRYVGPQRARRILGPWAPHVARLVPEVKKLVPDLPGLAPLPPQADRQRLLEGLVQFCLSLASRYPLIFFLDDLHWSDPSTLQFLHRLARHIAGERVLILGAIRDEAVGPDHPLTVLEQHLTIERLGAQLALQRLSPEAVTTLVAQKSDPEWESRAFTRRLQRETEGHPLFVAELLDRLLEEGLLLETETGHWQPSPEADLAEVVLDLPAPVRTILERRYQAAGAAAQQILDLAAVIGRNFDDELLRQASQLEIEEILDGLDELLQRQLIRERPEGQQATYEFSHHKIREVVYEGLSQARRNHLHRQVAGALAASYEGRIDAVVGRLARHDTEAGAPDKTAVYRRQDGKEAL
jgi:predicted ATPase